MPEIFAQLSPALSAVRDSIVTCELCPRLRVYCQEIARKRRRAYQEQQYWGLPVPGFGDHIARVLILGLAPGAHGANRTGRPFTGDGSGDFLFPILFDTGFASQPQSSSREDGLRLLGAWIGSVVRCAPPDDKPTPQEIRNCAVHLDEELAALTEIRVIVCLGRVAWEGYLSYLLRTGRISRKRDFAFGHGATYEAGDRWLVGSYHPSLRNTNTGVLNASMLRAVFLRARLLAESVPQSGLNGPTKAKDDES
ncbi:MAG: uracil-DNA glycosylase [Janthinobacterium lividum]